MGCVYLAGIHRTPAGQGEGPGALQPLTESTFLAVGWDRSCGCGSECPQSISRVYRMLGHLKLTNGIGSVATAFQLGPRGLRPARPSQP